MYCKCILFLNIRVKLYFTFIFKIIYKTEFSTAIIPVIIQDFQKKKSTYLNYKFNIIHVFFVTHFRLI